MKHTPHSIQIIQSPTIESLLSADQIENLARHAVDAFLEEYEKEATKGGLYSIDVRYYLFDAELEIGTMTYPADTNAQVIEVAIGTKPEIEAQLAQTTRDEQASRN
jgi:hypothetical protein